MKLPVVSAVALSLSLCSLSFTARAQEEAPPAAPPPVATPVGAPPAAGAFGAQGQLVINTDIPLNTTEPVVALVHRSESMNGGSSTEWGIVPALDYFVSPNLSVGGRIGVVHGDSSFGDVSTGSSTAILVGARVGYNVALTDALSLWPRLGLEYMRVSFDNGAGDSSSGYVIPLNLFVPVLWHPAQHFFVGGGPILTTDLIAKASGQNTSKETQIGIEGVLGGYFNL